MVGDVRMRTTDLWPLGPRFSLSGCSPACCKLHIYIFLHLHQWDYSESYWGLQLSAGFYLSGFWFCRTGPDNPVQQNRPRGRRLFCTEVLFAATSRLQSSGSCEDVGKGRRTDSAPFSTSTSQSEEDRNHSISPMVHQLVPTKTLNHYQHRKCSV